MSTGDYDSRPANLYQFADGNQNNQGDRTDMYQFNGGDGPNRLQEEGWRIPRNETRTYAFPMDSQGYPVINNYGTVNIYMAGGNGYDDASCRAQQAAKLNDMMSGRYDYMDDRYRETYAPEYNRMSDFRREALIRDGQRMDQQIRDQYSRSYYNPDAYYDRSFNDYAYRRPGSNVNYTHGGRDGISFYRSEPSYSSLPPWVNDDCFGTGRDRNGYRIFQDLLQTGLSYDIARRHARNGGYDDYGNSGRWDRRYDDYRTNPIEMMLMANAIGGNRWDRYSNRYFNDDRNISYTHGGRDGLSFYNQSPSWDRYGSGNAGLGLLQDGLQMAMAYDIARRSVPRYESHRNVDSYYGNNDRYANRDYDDRTNQHYARARHEMMRQRDAERIAYNRQRAMERQGRA